MARGFGRDKSRTALAVSAQTKITIEGDYEDDRIKASNVFHALGVTFSGNAVSSIQVLEDIDDLQLRVQVLEDWISNIYPAHIHQYDDDGVTEETTGVI